MQPSAFCLFQNISRFYTTNSLKDSYMIDDFSLPPTVIRVLIVGDKNDTFTIDFGDSDFGLSELIKALEINSVNLGLYVDFKITKVHRAKPTDREPIAGTDNVNFRFNDPKMFNPKDYDEIWFFGMSRFVDPKRPEFKDSLSLKDDELRIISQFMDNGGGVFATGDHQDIGNGLCARIPRVTSMRKWYFRYLGENGEPVAPPVGIPVAPPVGIPGFDPGLDLGQDSSTRHDTLRKGHDEVYQFDDQSDDIPQKIIPKMYTTKYWNKEGIFIKRYPHPLLSKSRGVINVLPDHMHEGECYVDEDLTKSFDFDGYTTTEYPILPKTGKRLKPEVIAEAIVIGGHITDNQENSSIDSPATIAKIFGVLGAYDGHKVNVGRVAVDSTWHHFININVIGKTPHNQNDTKHHGFNQNDESKKVYNDIKTYWRNLGVWLAPKKIQKSILATALWAIRWSYPLVEELSSRTVQEGLSREGILYLGRVARYSLNKISSEEQVIQWIIPYLTEIQDIVDPWWGNSESAPDLVFDVIVNSVLGGMILSIAKEFPERSQENKLRAERELNRVLDSGVYLGIKAAQETLQISVRQIENISSQIKRSGKVTPNNLQP
jgi:hypothetical protein